MTYLSPCLVAVVFIPETSEPASGSVRQKEASLGSSVEHPEVLFLISSEPPSPTGVIARPFAASEVPIPEQPQPSSSSIRQPERKSRPGPPYCSGMWVFIRPTSQAFSMISWGQVPSLSYSQATLRMSFSAKLCASSRRSFCSSVRVKSTTAVRAPLFGFQEGRLTGQSTVQRVPNRPPPGRTANATCDPARQVASAGLR